MSEKMFEQVQRDYPIVKRSGMLLFTIVVDKFMPRNGEEEVTLAQVAIDPDAITVVYPSRNGTEIHTVQWCITVAHTLEEVLEAIHDFNHPDPGPSPF